MSEPAIQVRRKGKGTQVWAIERLENKLVDMRDHYRDWKEGTEEEMVSQAEDMGYGTGMTLHLEETGERLVQRKLEQGTQRWL